MVETAARWRVSENGRKAHVVKDGTTLCGETGTSWRKVAGVPQCPTCAEAADE